jgi:uncharacterized lipoprotein YddW (UPF0748 family)
MSEIQRTNFALLYGVDPVTFLDGDNGGNIDPVDEWVRAPDLAPFLDSLYTEWRSAQIDSLIFSVRTAIGDLPLSAAVVPDAQRARVDKGQNWVGWVNDGVMDFVVPMAYSYEPGDLIPLVRRINRMIGADRYLVGLPVYGGRERYLGYSVSLLRQERVLGYSLFSYNELEKEPFSVRFLERVFFSDDEE